jgi:ABC-type multidrug transport system fused ATPase/permease subunit
VSALLANQAIGLAKIPRSASKQGPAMEQGAVSSGLPAVWAGRRRRYLSLLIGAGLGQAAAAGFSAHFFTHALARSGAGSRGLLFGALLAAAASVGGLRMAERVLSERLSQDYVHQIRLGLIRRNLADGKVKSLGVAVARTTNDLTSVKNWISQGVAPLAVGIPLIIGVGVALVLLNPLLLVGLVVPIAALVVAMKALAPVAYQRTRRVRKVRGRLSSQIADTLLSTAAIRSAGGSDRELARIGKHSQVLVAASINKAKVAGAMRGSAAATSGIITAMVIGTGLLAGLPTHTLAGAVTMLAFLATPIHELGQVVEYRQTYRAARAIIGPAIQPEPEAGSALQRVELTAVPSDGVDGTVTARLLLSDGTRMAKLAARPGARIVVDTGNQRLTSEVLERFVGLREGAAGQIVVGGNDLSATGPKDLRRLVGYAAQGMMLGRGTLARTVAYRCPGAGADEVNRVLESVDLAGRVAELARGANTVLVHGGEPLTIPERARLLLARAMLDNPTLLVFDHLDADLGKDGRTIMRRLLATYPGVVILASDDPEQIITPTNLWGPDGVHRLTQPLTMGRRSRQAS